MPDVAFGRHERAVDRRSATSRQKDGLAGARTPTTSSPTSRRAPSGRVPTRSPRRGCLRAGHRPAAPRLADCSAARRSGTVTPLPAMRAGSICDAHARAPARRSSSPRACRATRFRSASIAVRDAFEVDRRPCRGLRLKRVSATIGTSSMPLGLMIGAQTRRGRCGSQSAFELTVSYRRTSASDRAARRP